MFTNKYILSFDKAKIFYRYDPGNPTLVFIHGGGVNSLCWIKQYQYFKEKGCGVLAIDLRGHGKSLGKLNQNSFKNLTKDIELILEKEKIKKIILIGHSLGGIVSLAYNHYYPKRVSALVIIATAPNPGLSLKDGLKHLIRFYFRIKNARKKYTSYQKNGTSRHTPAMFHTSFLTLLQNYRAIKNSNCKDYLKGINKPVLILAAKDDEIFPPEKVKETAKYLKSYKFEIVPGRHLFIINNHLIVNKLIEDFIRGL